MPRFRPLLCLLLCLLLCPMLSFALAEESVCALIACGGEEIRVQSALLEGEEEDPTRWVFLPAFAHNADITWLADGRTFQPQWQDTEEEGVRACQLPDGETLYQMQSENLRALFLYSGDPENRGRLWLEDCENHERSIGGSMALVDTDGTVDFAGDIKKLRGRGNSTWYQQKKPYQMKLEDKADLLKNGEAPARTWLLLAEAMDQSLLHNRITFDLGLELGLAETSHSEHIDLYFDGEYRGTYLLCEKVEIGQGRIEETDYDKIIEKWSQKAGQKLDTLSTAQARNRYGQTIRYIDRLEAPESPTAGAYLLELDKRDGELCSFTLSNGTCLTLKSPEYASEEMVRYISQRMEEALNTLQNGGLNPDTGRTLEEDFDVDGFARTALIHELAYNLDGFTFASCFFVLPQGETRLRPGPLWDFDQAWRDITNGDCVNGEGVKGTIGWPANLYAVPAFAQAMQEIYTRELYPMVQQLLLGDDHGAYLRPLEEYIQQIAASRRMNDRIHSSVKNPWLLNGGTPQEDLSQLRSFIDQRSRWMNGFLQGLVDCGQEEMAAVSLSAQAIYTQMEDTLLLEPFDWSAVEASQPQLEQLSEATETEYAQYQLCFTVAPREGRSFAPDVYVLVNDQPVPFERQADGSLLVSARVEDPSYRPVDYDGDDVGYVFDYDWYLRTHPDIAALYGNDRQAILDYFFMEAIYQQDQGNAYFAPDRVKDQIEGLYDNLGETWDQYYWEFLAVGVEERWTSCYSAWFRLPVKEEP